jgi:hypothetical protein
MSDLSVNSILDASGGATTTINGFTPTVSNMAGRNRIINGDMRIDQRNAGAAVTVTSHFVVDRFRSDNQTGTGTMTGQRSTLGNSYSLKLTATAALTTLTTSAYMTPVVYQAEAQDIFNLNSKNVTVSFKVETNWTGNLAISIRKSDFSRSYVVDVAVTSGTNSVYVVIPFEAATIVTNGTGVGIMLLIGTNNEADFRTATTGSWQAGSLFVSTSSTQWAKTINNFVNVTEVQLEEGSVATPFEHRQYGQELALCQRYFQKFQGVNQDNCWAAGVAYAAGLGICSFTWSPPLRATATITSNGNFETVGTGVNSATLAFDQLTPFSAQLAATTTGLTSGGGCLIRTGTIGDSFISVSAEL